MFTGFSKETTEFLWGIRLNNSRVWYTENRQKYVDFVQVPLSELAGDVLEHMNEKDDLGAMCHISRIHRDVRRSRVRELYRDSLWFDFYRDAARKMDTPCLFFEIKPEGYAYGLGYYITPPQTMRKFRACLDQAPEKFEKIAVQIAEQDVFILRGEEYKRSKGEKAGVLSDWYNRKEISAVAERQGHGRLYSRRIVGDIVKGFETLLPLYNFLWSLEDSDTPFGEGEQPGR